MATAFGENLQRLMQKRNLTGRALARELDLPYKTVQEWVGPSGRIPRDPDTLKRVAQFFDCSIHFLLFGEEDPKLNLTNWLEKTVIHSGLYEITIKKVHEK